MTLRQHPTLGWQFRVGFEWRTIVDPNGPPSPRQLAWLARHGLLELRADPGERLTKIAAAHAIDRANGEQE